MSQQNDFQQKMARLNAKAKKEGRKTSGYDPYADLSSLKPSIFKQLFVFLLAVALVIASRALVFQRPEWFQILADNGISLGLFADVWLPVIASILVPKLIGHDKNGLWFPSLLGFIVGFWGENYVLILLAPEVFSVIYSPEYVAFVIEGGGNLEAWMNGDRTYEPTGLSVDNLPGIGERIGNLFDRFTGGEE